MCLGLARPTDCSFFFSRGLEGALINFTWRGAITITIVCGGFELVTVGLRSLNSSTSLLCFWGVLW